MIAQAPEQPLRVLWIGPVPPHPGGSAISLGEIASEVAKAGNQIRAIAPITKETEEAGDRFAAFHPELEIERYLIPEYDVAPYRQNRSDLVQAEGSALRALFPAAVRSFDRNWLWRGASRFPDPLSPWLELTDSRAFSWSEGLPQERFFVATIQIQISTTPQGIRRSRSDRYGGKIPGEGAEKSWPHQGDHHSECHRYLAVSAPTCKRKLFKELRIRKDQIVVLVPANLHPRKRPFDVVESASRALAQNPRLVYVMIGSGHLRGPVQARCRELNILDSFRFPGWIDYARMPEMMNLADVVAMASESEGMARAYLEAMACERLLLASDIPSTKELIRDRHNGLLFRVGDTEHLAALTLQAASDRKMAPKTGT